MLRENFPEFLREVIPHELAHLACYRLAALRRIPGNGSGHGRHWQGVMRTWFNVEPERTHKYDCTNSGAKRQRRWVYTCSAGHSLKLTTTRHRKAQRVLAQRGDGSCGYLCGHCRNRVTFTGEQAS
jgi:SprT protein